MALHASPMRFTAHCCSSVTLQYVSHGSQPRPHIDRPGPNQTVLQIYSIQRSKSGKYVLMQRADEDVASGMRLQQMLVVQAR